MERSGLLGAVQMVKLIPDSNHSVRGETLRQAIKRDKDKGNIPFFVSCVIKLIKYKDNISNESV